MGKFKTWWKAKMADLFYGNEGSILDYLGKFFQFLKEYVETMNEGMRIRRNERDRRRGGED